MYEVEVRHDGLHKYRLIRGRDLYVVEEKARAQVAQWNEMWRKRQERERAKEERAAAARDKEAKKAFASFRSKEAQDELAVLEGILHATLDYDDVVDFEDLKDHGPFPEPPPPNPVPREVSPKPRRSDPGIAPRITVLDRLLWFPAKKKRRESELCFEEALESWEQLKNSDLEANQHDYVAFEEAAAAWRQSKREFLASQSASHAAIDADKAAYRRGEPAAISDYCDLVLTRSAYPDYFPQEFDLAYVEDTKSLIVDYRLPCPSDLPTLREVRYVQSRDSMEEKHLSARQVATLFDRVVYQVSLRTIHELFEADQVDALLAVTFNGWVEFIDPSTGVDTRSCIVSIQASRQEFMAVNLAQVEPKACFRSLKGVGSSKLHSLTAVAPVARVDREDSRFIESKEVVKKLDEGDNLAAMPWDEFEHLVRELFEREFAAGGAEVRVTRASRDGGVDAVIMDPDPIRGGKIVVQAKRYTATVGVEAVRDLYGTVMNEGALKGILVTTSDFGPSAYGFAKDKPLTLLNGGNLLHLLAKHGHKARIDVAEARDELGLS